MNLPRKLYANRQDKVVDFILGFAGWFVLNGVLWAIVYGLGLLLETLGLTVPADADFVSTVQGWIAIVLGCLPLLINIALMALLAFTRPWITVGALTAFGVVFVIVLCISLIIGVSCFAIISGIGNTP